MPAAFRLATGVDDLNETRRLCRDYRALLTERARAAPWLVERYYAESQYEALLDRLPELHARPDGAIFVAVRGGQICGCAMTHRIGPETCEIKRVFTDPAARGHGLARGLFAAAMDQARADGYREMKLDTMIWLEEAIGLYGKLGFTPCPPFYDLAPDAVPYIRFFGRAL